MSSTIKFPSIPENILIAEQFVEDLRAIAKIRDCVYEDIMVALSEAANNAMCHGNRENAEKNVVISCKLDESGELLSLVVKDEGPGFDFMNIPDPTTPENIKRENGRGVYLMKELTHSVFFSNHGATVNMLFSL